MYFSNRRPTIYFCLVVPGTEELSGDEDITTTPPRNSGSKSNDKTKYLPKPKLKRPKILKRRGSRNAVKDWGERCVDVFEVINQIGEGSILNRIFGICK